jgi:hypothetical protein
MAGRVIAGGCGVNAAMEWIVGRDRGLSSEAIWARMMGVPGQTYHPHDAGDFGRCARLLDAVPEWRPRMGNMAALSPEWKALVDIWDELDGYYRADDGKAIYAAINRACDAVRFCATCGKRALTAYSYNRVTQKFACWDCDKSKVGERVVSVSLRDLGASITGGSAA